MLDLLIYFGIYLAVVSAVVGSGVFMYSALDGTRDMKIESSYCDLYGWFLWRCFSYLDERFLRPSSLVY